MTTRPIDLVQNQEESTETDLVADPKPRYQVIDHWIVLSLNGGQGKVLKLQPTGLTASEVAVKIRVMVPEQRSRILKTITIKLPDMGASVSDVELSIADPS